MQYLLSMGWALEFEIQFEIHTEYFKFNMKRILEKKFSAKEAAERLQLLMDDSTSSSESEEES